VFATYSGTEMRKDKAKKPNEVGSIASKSGSSLANPFIKHSFCTQAIYY